MSHPYIALWPPVAEIRGSPDGGVRQQRGTGDFQHERRDALSEKNLLAVGDVTAAEVVGLLPKTRGDQYSSSSHDWDAATAVHVFKPVVNREQWYIKAYFLDPSDESAMFISVHK